MNPLLQQIIDFDLKLYCLCNCNYDLFKTYLFKDYYSNWCDTCDCSLVIGHQNIEFSCKKGSINISGPTELSTLEKIKTKVDKLRVLC